MIRGNGRPDDDGPDHAVVTRTLTTAHGQVTLVVSSDSEAMAKAMSVLCTSAIQRALHLFFPEQGAD